MSIVAAGETEDHLLPGDPQVVHCGLRCQPLTGLLVAPEQGGGQHTFRAAELVPDLIDRARGEQPAAVHHAERRTHFGELAQNVRADENRRARIREVAQRGA